MMSGWVLWQVFARSFFLQASWNPQGMQNLGMAYALFPALERLYPSPEEQAAAVRRHLVFFNTHPYVAAAILGGVLYHEERLARGEEGPERVAAFKAALMGPLAALGDGFFWLSLRPAVGALCAALVPLLGAWSALLFLVLYNLVHLFLRARLFWLGFTLGDRLVEGVAAVHLPQKGARLRALAAASAGGLAAWLAIAFGAGQAGTYAPLLSGGCLAMGALAFYLVGRQVSRYAVLYASALLAAIAGAFL
ncbi:MAG: PTS system mannose/fructose/sorbose family transporter subunit IID [Myxococcota bacterium]